ncbi:MAG TPA: hypothetical protein VFS51_13560, partial [Gemmatimonadales bacterium]|nr:hypothetical protein [Gemmatimonadales bacterium]
VPLWAASIEQDAGGVETLDGGMQANLGVGIEARHLKAFVNQDGLDDLSNIAVVIDNQDRLRTLRCHANKIARLAL